MQLELLPDGLDGKLIHVEEECAEVLQEVCKMRRFGPDNWHPREPEKGTNRKRLLTEMSQLRDAINRLEEELLMTWPTPPTGIHESEGPLPPRPEPSDGGGCNGEEER